MLPDGYEKVSFRRFAVEIDFDRLMADYVSIPDQAWANSYWGDVHCSVGMLLLRGGNTGTPEDFYCEQVSDNDLLAGLPYIESLLAENGPFGGANYAFFFKTKAHGVTLIHTDLMDIWRDMYRIHVPITSNPEACLVAEDKVQHFEVGYAWTFDNHSNHGVVNGGTERVHLIFDVPFNPVLKRCIDAAKFFPGKDNPEYVQKIRQKDVAIASYAGDVVIRKGIGILRSQGLDDAQIADFMNSKGMPTKRRAETDWTATTVAEMLPHDA